MDRINRGEKQDKQKTNEERPFPINTQSSEARTTEGAVSWIDRMTSFFKYSSIALVRVVAICYWQRPAADGRDSDRL